MIKLLNGSEIAKVNIENVRVSQNDNDYAKVTDSQKTMNSKLMQAINDSKIGSHERLVADKLDAIDKYTPKDYWEEGK